VNTRCNRTRLGILSCHAEEVVMANRKDRVRIRIWRLAEGSAEGPLGIGVLLVALTTLVAGVVLGWW
jgi:hypothetical protein